MTCAIGLGVERGAEATRHLNFLAQFCERYFANSRGYFGSSRPSLIFS
jgi:Tfp pilus assembly protein PilE